MLRWNTIISIFSTNNFHNYLFNRSHFLTVIYETLQTLLGAITLIKINKEICCRPLCFLRPIPPLLSRTTRNNNLSETVLWASERSDEFPKVPDIFNFLTANKLIKWPLEVTHPCEISVDLFFTISQLHLTVPCRHLILRTVNPFATAHMFCASLVDPRNSGFCLLIEGVFCARFMTRREKQI